MASIFRRALSSGALSQFSKSLGIQSSLEKLAHMRVTGQSGAGLVKATMSSNGKIESLVIDDLVKTKSPNAIEDLVREAINDAVEKVDAEVERVTNEEMRKVATDPNAMKVRIIA